MVLIILITNAIILMIGFSILGYYSTNIVMSQKKTEAQSLADRIIEYSTTALVFDHPERVNTILSKLEKDQDIMFCYLYNSSGQLFSSYKKTEHDYQKFPEIISNDDISFTKGNYYHLFKKIYYKNDFYGYLYLAIDTYCYENLAVVAFLIIVTFLLLIFMTYLIAKKLQTFISTPILKLSHIANQISRSGDYSIRLPSYSKDELGHLYDEFNNLLNEIEKRENERDHVQSELQNREQWISTIINNLNDAVIVHDAHTGNILYANETASKLYGYSLQKFITLSIGELSINDDFFNQITAMENVDKCFSEGPQIYEWLARKNNGSTFWAEINSRKAQLDGVDRILVVIKNIDDRKKHQRELSSLQQYLQDMIDFMPSIIISTDEKLKITQWNRMAYEFTHLSPTTVIGKNLFDFDTGFPPLEADIKNSIDSFQIIELQKIKILKPEKNYFFNITIYPISSISNTGAVIRMDDVSDHVNMEEMMIQSEKMMSVGGLAAGMAHEINNPLAGMMQNATVVLNRITKSSPKNEEIAREIGISFTTVTEFLKRRNITKQLQLIKESGLRASTIISNMLRFARKSESKFKYRDLCQIMDISIDLAQNDYDLKKKFDFRKIIIRKQYQPNMMKCYCDASKLEQVFLNLLKNGAHAMNDIPDRTSKFTIRISQTRKKFIIEIEDNGTGIPEEIKNRIFEPFYTTKEVGVGTGLGLSVSYFIITDNHKGQMYVSSKENEGTKFTIELPMEGK